MTAQDFTYWLQGFFELTNTNVLTEQQVAVIKEHLNLCFKKETQLTVPSSSNPSYCSPPPTKLCEGIRGLKPMRTTDEHEIINMFAPTC